jgi:L-aspartate oxidase
VYGARAARAAVEEPAAAGPDHADPRPGEKPPALSAASREALWRHAGLERDGAGLQTLTSDHHPLVRLIAQSGLARTETRGAHLRTDFPQRKAGLDGHHVLMRLDRPPILDKWE